MFPTKTKLKEYGYEGYCDYFSDNIRKVHKHEKKRKDGECDYPIVIYKKYPKTFRVATYNVHNFVNLCSHINPARNIDPIVNIISKAKADVVFLQEIKPISKEVLENDINLRKDLNKLNFDNLIEKMEQKGYKYHIISNTMEQQNFFKLDNNCYYYLGNAIFSKLPLVNSITVLLPGNRNVIISEINVDNEKILVACTHLELHNGRINAQKLMKYYDTDNLIKLQANTLVNTIQKELINRNIKGVILGGDLNNDLNNPDLLPIADFFFNIPSSKKKYFNRNKIKKDYILIKNVNIPFLGEQEIISNYSDHNMIISDFTNDQKNYDILLQKTKYQILNHTNYLDYANVIKKINTKKTNTKKLEFITKGVSDYMIGLSHMEYPEWYGTDNIKLLKRYIAKFDYYTPMNELYKTYQNNRYKKLLPFAKKLSGKPLSNNYLNNNSNPYVEEILLNYIKCRPNMKTIVFWPTSEWYKKNTNFNRVIKKLRSKGTIYYSKIIELNYQQGANLIFNMYLTTNRNKNIKHVYFNTESKGWDKKYKFYKKKVLVLFYEYDGNQEDITGSNAYFKDEVRNMLLTDDKRIYDILHINDFYSETIDNSGLFLNSNSLQVLKAANVYSIVNNTDNKICNQLNSFKKVLCYNFDLLEQERFVLSSSFVLFCYGVRKFNDLDGMIIYSPKPNSNFLKKYNAFFDINGPEYQPYIDLTMKNTILYEPYITQFKDKIANVMGCSNFEEMAMDPKYYYYYFGLKTIILPFELVKRAYRFRPKSLLDIIKTGNLLNRKMRVPYIPDKIDIDFYYNPDMTRKKMIQIMINYTISVYNKKMSKEELESFISNYKITETIYDIDLKKDRKVFFHKLGYAYGFNFLKELPYDNTTIKSAKKSKVSSKKSKVSSKKSKVSSKKSKVSSKKSKVSAKKSKKVN